ncbi:transcription factor IBH1-like 1 [Olea europaea subsp. europaea]|uniref:Transcription factor IBH1-like 1 n=1 Tax=Olea europaea subsp. europaea TaxID=158383 RepID=A0A8S0PUD3_OLEEU|nr:transcription factor IBH1-like 1 [Olea europaea subsp. europaea]
MKARTSDSTSLKQEFVKKWIKGLHIYSNVKKDMSILERKRAIKLSADMAIASTRDASTLWSRTLMANISKNETKKILVEPIFSDSEVTKKKASNGLMAYSNRIASKKILRRSHITKIRARKMDLGPKAVKVSSIAKKLVKNRTQVLKSLVPGGENMDEISLIKETLDYIVSLRVQVDVMRRLASAAVYATRSP